MTMRTEYLQNSIVLVLLDCASSGYAEESQFIIKDEDKMAFLGDSITAGGANYKDVSREVCAARLTRIGLIDQAHSR